MPRLDEVHAALLANSTDRSGASRESEPADPDRPFASIARAAIDRVAEPRVARAAFEALGSAGLLEPGPLANVELLELDDLFRSSKIKLPPKSLRPLQRIARWAADRDFDADQAASLSTELIREEWRSLNGVGPTLVEVLLLFGLGRLTYPVDRGTYRILVRHGWLDPSADLDEARSTAVSMAPDEPEALARISRDFDQIARDHCKPSVARCDSCPLRSLLPTSGPFLSED